MENWKTIPGYEGLYEASDEGRIRTAEGKTTRSARFEVRHWKQRILKPKIQKRPCGNNSDFRVSLWKDGVEKTHLVSRLVAMAWCDGYEKNMTVNHIDGNSLNNNANNLEWVSLKENVRHAFRTGIHKNQIACVLVSNDGKQKEFVSCSEASRYLGHSSGYIHRCIMKKKNAKAVDGEVYHIAV